MTATPWRLSELDLSGIRASALSRIQALNKAIQDWDMFRWVPAFTHGDSGWDQQTTLSIRSFEETPNQVVDFRLVDSPKAENHGKDDAIRVILHDKGQCAVCVVVVNEKFLITTMQHRDAIQRYVEELPREITDLNDCVRRSISLPGPDNAGEVVLYKTLPGLRNLLADSKVTISSTKAGEAYKDTAVHSGTDEIYLIKISIPEFTGNETALLQLINTVHNYVHPKVRLLADVVSRKFHFNDIHSNAAIYELLPELEKLVE